MISDGVRFRLVLVGLLLVFGVLGIWAFSGGVGEVEVVPTVAAMVEIEGCAVIDFFVDGSPDLLMCEGVPYEIRPFP